MNAVTYSLKLDSEKNSETYYRTIRAFADEASLRAEQSLASHVDDYITYLRIYRLEEIRDTSEYVLELLSFGILWRTYAPYALAVRVAPFVTLARLGEWRKKHPRWKPAIDAFRGVLITLCLLPRVRNEAVSPPTLEQIDRVCLWFEATGEFREQALRFIRWRAYWSTLDATSLHQAFGAIAAYTDWFEQRSREVLGAYTAHVEAFLGRAGDRYRWREDRISCSRSRIEYHLNMVGAEMMNRAFRHEFDSTDATAVLLPGCMRNHVDGACKALKKPKGLRCIGCEPTCRVNRLRVQGAREGFSVYVIPHASDLSLWTPKNGEPSCGVIASACVTTLVEGGWELKRYGVPAQCILLENSGCKKHWHHTGVATAINPREMERIRARRIRISPEEAPNENAFSKESMEQ